MHSSLTIANRLLQLARASGTLLTPMQLLKLVFLAHGWMLGLYRRALIRDQIEAWKYGPVIPALYHSIKSYRNGPVVKITGVPHESLDEFEEDLVQQVFKAYGSCSGPALSQLTHEPGSPWEQVFENDGWGLVIPNEVIREYYEQQAATA
jgi:uncharacterized phage-associated protein